ncbi:hypothetical protein FB451DRAFT_1550752 [Mycena latifolia]|nr:hypothetical protein FB451DRAFT_1550752 [Mycena latifolia]
MCARSKPAVSTTMISSWTSCQARLWAGRHPLDPVPHFTFDRADKLYMCPADSCITTSCTCGTSSRAACASAAPRTTPSALFRTGTTSPTPRASPGHSPSPASSPAAVSPRSRTASLRTASSAMHTSPPHRLLGPNPARQDPPPLLPGRACASHRQPARHPARVGAVVVRLEPHAEGEALQMRVLGVLARAVHTVRWAHLPLAGRGHPRPRAFFPSVSSSPFSSLLSRLASSPFGPLRDPLHVFSPRARPPSRLAHAPWTWTYNAHKQPEASAALHCLSHPPEHFPASKLEGEAPHSDEYATHARSVRHVVD